MTHPRFYNTQRWKKLRRKIKLDAGLGDVRGIHVHHRMVLADHPALALERANLKPISAGDHAREHACDRRRPGAQGCDVNGNPLSEHHPWAKARGGSPKNLVGGPAPTGVVAREKSDLRDRGSNGRRGSNGLAG